ncbi:uncharacterized protein LOC130712326 [Lotus japonicus]|uniref:uncharacterized protein LOC130712326 n=1 Tax=Lotus japonicus TaxID=34305 RepID=UPI002584E6FC|nr:uncharacterized protein LOC130712326 [Lotus japonicus]
MIKELTLRQGVYHGMYGTDTHYEKVLQALHLAPNEFATEEKWLCVPDMGHIVATMYQVLISTDFPLPTVNPQWMYHCTVEARGWQLPYLDRMALFNKLSQEANADIHKVDGIINLAED